jgi:hypothetical protein
VGTAHTAAIGMSAFIGATGVSAITVTGAIGLSPFMATEATGIMDIGATGIMDIGATAATATAPAGGESSLRAKNNS